MSENRIGEVVEASTTEFIAQCYELYCLPPLGAMVKASDGSHELYGIVYHAQTAGIEPGRRPIARGKDEPSEEAIYRANPQLTQLLRSEFSALVVGHRQYGQLYQYLPPQPARIHGFVHLCSDDEIKEFSQSFDFLNILINARQETGMEELVAAALRQMSRSHEDKQAFLVAAGKELALLLSGQFPQLKAILGRIK